MSAAFVGLCQNRVTTTSLFARPTSTEGLEHRLQGARPGTFKDVGFLNPSSLGGICSQEIDVYRYPVESRGEIDAMASRV